MSLRYSFFAIVPDGIIEIPQGSNLSWLTLFYALPRELVEKYPAALSLPRNIYELLDDPGLSFRLTAPYSEERRNAASEWAKKNGCICKNPG